VPAADRRRTVRDWAVAVAAALAMSVRVAIGPAAEVSRAGQTAAFALAGVAGLALVRRRRRPRTAAAVAVAASALHALIAGPVLPVVGWLAIVVVARHVPALRAALWAAIVAAAGVSLAVTAGALAHDGVSALPLVVSLTLVVTMAAALARVQAARADAQRRQWAAEGQRAVAGERLRIARDVHDLVGHGLSTIAVQAGAARLALAAGDPAAAGRAVGAIEEASRGALAEMRQLLGVLRPDDDAGEAPAPGLDGTDALAERARAAGHRVTVERSGALAGVPAAAGLTAYRVLQEAVTNAIRHAPGAPIAIALRAEGGGLAIEVADGGSGRGASDADGPRYGLLGLRERVAAAGGTMEAGPRADGPGWRVLARLPIQGRNP
jgi:MYXO-CTERM domain-containing protein